MPAATLLEGELLGTRPEQRAWAAVGLSRLDEAERWLETDAAASGREAAVALALARGDLMGALEVGGDDPAARRERALALGHLGRIDEALALVGGSGDALDRLRSSELHVMAHEAAQASLALPADALDASDCGSAARAAEASVRLLLARGESRVLQGEAASGLADLKAAFRQAGRLGSVTLLARVLSRLAESHADRGNRWRALRAATRAASLVSAGGVAPLWVPGILFRAYVIYGIYDHLPLADAALREAHAALIRLASGIERREYRETFLIDNRENQRVVASFKGETAWGTEVPRA